MANIQIKDIVTVTPNVSDLVVISQGNNTRSATVQEIRGVVNDLTSGGNDKTLSAEQGKILNLKIDDISNPLAITLTLNPTTAEKGSTVSSTAITWTCSKAVASQTFEGVTIDSALRAYTYVTPLTASKTFTLVDTTIGGATVTKTATLNFYNGIYYGVSSSTTYNSALISSLATKVLSETKGRTISVTAGSGQYIYYCVPTRLGSCSFSVGGFSGGFSKVGTISFTNPSGFVEDYDIYKSDNANLGTTSVVIS